MFLVVIIVCDDARMRENSSFGVDGLSTDIFV